MSETQYQDNSLKVLTEVNQAIVNFLEEAAGEIETGARDNTPSGYDALRAQWRHEVNQEVGEAYIGNDAEYAIWQEMGTGEYAINGDGRKDVPWRYQDDAGEWHITNGVRPKQMLTNSWNSRIKAIQNHAKKILGGIKG